LHKRTVELCHNGRNVDIWEDNYYTQGAYLTGLKRYWFKSRTAKMGQRTSFARGFVPLGSKLYIIFIYGFHSLMLWLIKES